jgi:hypothetical protein
MVLGLPLATFTAVHVVLSLIGIGTGIVVLVGMLRSNPLPGVTAVFLVTTILTSVTGFFFPSERLLPSHVVGVLSLIALAAAVVALYGFRLAGPWRWIYVVGAVVALYFNVFVGVVQAFLKIPPLTALAPTQAEPPFAIAQVFVLVVFAWLGFKAVRSFHPAASAPAPSAV